MHLGQLFNLFYGFLKILYALCDKKHRLPRLEGES